MSKKKTKSRPAQARATGTTVLHLNTATFKEFCGKGYTPLSNVPEVQTAVDTIAMLIASMTIHLVSNTRTGDKRIQNQLSRFLDIEPNPYLTRYKLMFWLARVLQLEGDGNAVIVPRTKAGMLYSLDPVAPGRVSFGQDGYGYSIYVDGIAHDPAELLHFTLNPDAREWWRGRGYRVALRTVADNLVQAGETAHTFMKSEWAPSLIVKVDGLVDEFASPEGRKKLTEDYLKTTEKGDPWLIPADAMEVQSVKPLSLSDLAISDTVKLSKKTVATIIGVPPFVLGEGVFNKAEWNNFVNTRIMPMAQGIQQELTRKLILSPDWYVKFNSRSLLSYDIKELADVGDNQYTRGIMTGNEVRDWLNLDPVEGLDELVILENYIPQGMIGDQAKLKGAENGET